MSKIITVVFYGVCFLLLFGTIYQLIVTPPPPPGSDSYRLYQGSLSSVRHTWPE